jgi:hypothetical protein
MCMEQLVWQVDIAEALRQILQAHIRMLDGHCRGCFVEYSRWVPHPCIPADWAARTDGHLQTVRFLTQ